jgi:hypothetical protein
MTIRRWMLTLGIIVSAVCGFALAQALWPSDACSYEYPCDENPDGCTNNDGCLGECRCDIDFGKCVPLYE